MPKRIATPPPGDDEPRYLTVVYPYAISGTCNMELPKDRQDFAYWVACCVDKDAFFAIYHKPKSRGMVIIEIDRSYQYLDRILGEHRWSEFLQNPTEEEEDKYTQVFFCAYSTGRIVQKNGAYIRYIVAGGGWKRIDVDEAWFKTWSPKNKQIKFPYPPPHFCDAPREDQTNHSMCRPLPGAVVTPPPDIAAPQPVVGSAAWIEQKGGSASATGTTQSKANVPPNAWAKGAPKAISPKPRNPTANGAVKKAVGIPQGPPTGARQPAVGGGPVVVKSSNVWENMGRKSATSSAVRNWDDSGPISRESTPLTPAISPVSDTQVPPSLPARGNAWGINVASRPTLPPGLTQRSSTASSAAQGVPPRTLSAASWGSNGVSTSSPDSDSGPDLTTATESDNPHPGPRIFFPESMEEEFHGEGIRLFEGMDDEGELRELDAIAPGAWDEPHADGAWETTAVGAWDDTLDAEDHWNRTQPQLQENVTSIKCNAHGLLCKKGICAEYAKQLRLAKRAEEAEQRKAGANKEKKGRFRGRGASKNDGDSSGNGNGNKAVDNQAAQNNQFRGPGAPVKTNWRGAPRVIATADSTEKRETTKDDGSDGWGNSDWEDAPTADAVVPGDKDASTDAAPADATSNASWGVSENTFDPWATPTPAQPAAKVNQPAGGAGGRNNKWQGKKTSNSKPAQTKAPSSSNWADQVEAELAKGAANTGGGSFSVATSKRGKKSGASNTGWSSSSKTSDAKSSTSGWGSSANQAMPW